MKEFLVTILSEAKRPQITRLSKDGKFSERNPADQKFFSVSGMGFGQQAEGIEAEEQRRSRIEKPPWKVKWYQTESNGIKIE